MQTGNGTILTEFTVNPYFRQGKTFSTDFTETAYHRSSSQHGAQK